MTVQDGNRITGYKFWLRYVRANNYCLFDVKIHTHGVYTGSHSSGDFLLSLSFLLPPEAAQLKKRFAIIWRPKATLEFSGSQCQIK